MSQWLNEAAGQLGASPFQLPAQAYSDPREELISAWSEGTATFIEDQKYLQIKANVFRLTDLPDGTWSGIYEFEVPLVSTFKVPPPAPPPFNQPTGPIPQPAPQAYGNARWDFADGSSLTVVGPAVMSSVRTSVLETIVWISANHLISVGTGRYEGAQGTKTGAIGLWLPEGASLKDATEVKMKSLDAFRIVRKEFIGEAPDELGG